VKPPVSLQALFQRLPVGSVKVPLPMAGRLD